MSIMRKLQIYGGRKQLMKSRKEFLWYDVVVFKFMLRILKFG
jgi:hypothetical protein